MALNVYDHADAGTKLVIDRLKARIAELEEDLRAVKDHLGCAIHRIDFAFVDKSTLPPR